MILQNLTLIRQHFENAKAKQAVNLMDITIRRFEKLQNDIIAASAIDGNERIIDLIEEEMEEET